MNRLIDDGDQRVPRQRGQPRFAYPFQNFPIPDRYARVIARGFSIRPPRFDPATAGRTSYTNLLKASNTLNDLGQWTLFQATPTAAETAPDGAGAWRLTEDAVPASTHGIKQDFSFPDSHNYVRYILAKAGERSRFELTMLGSVEVARGFDVQNGVTFANTRSLAEPTASGLVALENGWWLCWMSQTLDGGISSELYINDGTNTDYDGDDTKGIFLAYDHLVAMALSDLKPVFATTTAARTISAPLLDPGDVARAPDPFAYIVDETDPTPDPVGRLVWDRNFARVPATQVQPGSLIISKPDFTGTFPQRLGLYVIRKNDPSIARYDGFLNFTVVSDTGAPAFPTTGGTYTITFEGDTTGALAYDASAGTVETALNALPSIIARGGCTVTGTFSDPDGFLVTWNSYAPCTVDMSALILTSGTPFDATSSINDGFTQIPQISAFPNNFTGGTWTITIFGQTTGALQWNALLTDVETELNALSEVIARGGCTVSGDPANGGKVINASHTVISCTINFENPPFTGDATSLLPTGSIITGTNFDLVTTAQRIKFQAPATRTIVTQVAHGMSGTSRIYITADAINLFDVFPGTFTILDDFTIQITVLASYPYASIGTITDTGRLTRADYAPGSANVRVSKVKNFYLPGVTPGISSANQIPIPPGQSENSFFLQAVFSGVGTLNWAVGAIEQWRGPILSVETTTIQASDL